MAPYPQLGKPLFQPITRCETGTLPLKKFYFQIVLF